MLKYSWYKDKFKEMGMGLNIELLKFDRWNWVGPPNRTIYSKGAVSKNSRSQCQLLNLGPNMVTRRPTFHKDFYNDTGDLSCSLLLYVIFHTTSQQERSCPPSKALKNYYQSVNIISHGKSVFYLKTQRVFIWVWLERLSHEEKLWSAISAGLMILCICQ